MTHRLFGDVRVIDTTTGIAGSYCAKVLGDAGAEVVLLETADGHPLRRWTCSGPPPDGQDGALFRFLHHGHRSVTALEDRTVAEADVVLVELDGPLGDPVALAARCPHLVVAVISPWGSTGPFAGLPWSDLVVQAEGGSPGVRGRADTDPLQMGGHVNEWVTGVYAAVGTLAALRTAKRDGVGELVDVSMLEVCNLSSNLFSDLTDYLRGRPDLALMSARSYETPSIEPTLDGYVGFNTNTRLQFEAFALMIERPDLLDDPTWASVGSRYLRFDEWNEIVRAWTTRHTTADIVELAAALRIPVAPVGDAPILLGVDHIVERDIYQPDPTGTFLTPRRPWSIDGELAPAARPAPEVGADNGRLAPRQPIATPTTSPRRSPLDGLRVLDLTAWWAGPSSTAALAAFGADVIHVESTGHPDGLRMAGGIFIERPQWWELAAMFLQANTNKRGLTLDLRSKRGRELLLRLVAESDIIVENFTPRVFEQFDLGWDVIHATNPQAIMVRMPAFGLTGPWRDRPGFAQTMEQVTGLAWVTGFEHDQPRIQRGPCDPNAGMHAVVATFAALEHRDQTGVGCVVEVPMVESALNVAAEVVIEWTAYGNRLSRMGNRSWRAAPQGIYRCAGREQWVALSVESDEQWTNLCGVAQTTDAPEMAEQLANAAWTTEAGRRLDHDVIDAVLASWLADRDAGRVVADMRAAGVPAGEVCDPRRTSEHPQVVARGFYETVDHEVAGAIPAIGLPFRFASVDRWVRTPPPLFGEHNAEILQGILGLSDADLAALAEAEIIGTRPKGL